MLLNILCSVGVKDPTGEQQALCLILPWSPVSVCTTTSTRDWLQRGGRGGRWRWCLQRRRKVIALTHGTTHAEGTVQLREDAKRRPNPSRRRTRTESKIYRVGTKENPNLINKGKAAMNINTWIKTVKKSEWSNRDGQAFIGSVCRRVSIQHFLFASSVWAQMVEIWKKKKSKYCRKILTPGWGGKVRTSMEAKWENGNWLRD